MARVCILDYGAGNIRSVYNLFVSIDAETTVSNRPSDISDATHLVLPGVGAFGEAMRRIADTLPMGEIAFEVRGKGKPFLGICVGMQVLGTKGLELGEHDGLDWISGTVRRLDAGSRRLPHVGWNNMSFRIEHPFFKGLPQDVDFYYVHSYAFVPNRLEDVLATSCYEEEFPCVVGHDNVLGVQFHPEKSQAQGAKLMLNFLALS